MAGEEMDIADNDCPVFSRGGPADPFAQGNMDTGRFALEWSQKKPVFLHQVKPCPIDLLQGAVNQRCRVA